MSYIICTFHTPDYRSYFDEWVNHIQNINRQSFFSSEIMHVRVLSKCDKGQWSANTRMKPDVILDTMEEYPDKSVLWIDIDGLMMKRPLLIDAFSEDDVYDIAARRLPPMKHERSIIGDIWQDKIITTPTLWVANNENGREIVKLWAKSCSESTNNYIGDHINLNMVVRDNADRMGLRFYDLPFTYSYCTHHYNRKGLEETEDNIDEAVIIQGIASRKHRSGVEKCQFKKSLILS